MKDFEELYKKYNKKIFAFCLTLTRNGAEAEELAAETFFRAIQRYKDFRGESDFGVWLCSIARNLFLNEEKKKKHKLKPEPPPDFDAEIEDKENAARILVAMNSLEEPYRGVFFLKVIGKLDGKNIGKIYGKSESWVYVTYYRAKLKIIEKLEADNE